MVWSPQKWQSYRRRISRVHFFQCVQCAKIWKSFYLSTELPYFFCASLFHGMAIAFLFCFSVRCLAILPFPCHKCDLWSFWSSVTIGRKQEKEGAKQLYVFISQISIIVVFLQMNSWPQSLERSPGHEMVHHRNGGCNPCRRLPEVAVREPADRDFQMTERQ